MSLTEVAYSYSEMTLIPLLVIFGIVWVLEAGSKKLLMQARRLFTLSWGVQYYTASRSTLFLLSYLPSTQLLAQ